MLAEVTGGAVFHDWLGSLHAARTALTWYPGDIWRYVWPASGHDRPYRVIDGGRFVAILRDSISADSIRWLPLTGAVDQFIGSTDAAGEPGLLRAAVSARLGS